MVVNGCNVKLSEDLSLLQATYPVTFLFSRSLKFPTGSNDVLKQYRYFPHLSEYKPHTISDKGSRRVYLELSLG